MCKNDEVQEGGNDLILQGLYKKTMDVIGENLKQSIYNYYNY